MSDEKKLQNRIDRRIWVWLKIRENMELDGFLSDEDGTEGLV